MVAEYFPRSRRPMGFQQMINGTSYSDGMMHMGSVIQHMGMARFNRGQGSGDLLYRR